MDLFNGILSIHGVSFLMISVIAIAALGYILGRITIKGISLGTAGVFIVALIYGCIFYKELSAEINTDFVTNALKIIDNLGLILFVTAVGFIAGPNFFGNFKKNFKSYVLLAIIIILSGGLACAGCIAVGRNFTDLSTEEFTAMLTGILSGALTSTPGFSAAKDAVGSDHLQSIVSVGYAIAYIFGVIGVVLFVQIIPKLMKADMAKERELLAPSGKKDSKEKKMYKLIEMDDFGIMPFALAAVLGIVIGSFKFGNFSLSTTGGCLLVSLIFGHFGHFGKISVTPKDTTLKVFRELGLMFFLIGAGVSGGAKFVQYFDALYFVYGMIMTILPMIIGFLFAKYVLKLSLLNNLGSITGGMTSTPALGTLISTAGTENVASAYAATYPVALISVVLVSQFLIILFK
ncbi:permease [Ruminococcus flavefaciens]|uniref:aspartate-alanine antiporter-like transporter n=1 Tax=Ruminococcus flavefaciens TaxID=1265 RepID=UPI0026EBC8AF|nr:permease [Ruminococcus flavefaciens]MDD7517249.1 permease [Ruminococcus flavefaciens]MDY5691264.1 permease [Ruminococcus flavefaciens]